eukprot:TRINITY_DN26571_c0_g1_i1.p1 TRINITY_DN26571_c0_g1~~TRINITY_DN26571_c0_g1_i1.p1  ORF type:complete len:463 (-),score=34.42 TRINITY_DN26571_c0_g1_i1:46-1404(-)
MAKPVPCRLCAGQESSMHYYEDLLAHRHFDVEDWFEVLSDNEKHFFVFLPIERPLAHAMIHCYQRNFLHRRVYTSADSALLHALYHQLQPLFEPDDNGNSKRYFVRLSSRSPKDGLSLNFESRTQQFSSILNSHGVTTEMWDELQSWNEAGFKKNEVPSWVQDYTKLNQILRELFVALHECMQIGTAEELLAMLLTSERAFTDLWRALSAYEAASKARIPTHWRQHLILKEWNPKINDSFEFRCFVHQGRLTAISQYNMYVYVHETNGNEMDIAHSIWAEWNNTTKLRYPQLENYIVDYAVCLNMPKTPEGTYEVIFIEINPFKNTTGASLFHWRLDEAVLFSKVQPGTNKDKMLCNPTDPECTTTITERASNPEIAEFWFEQLPDVLPIALRVRRELTDDPVYHGTSLCMLHSQWFGGAKQYCFSMSALEPDPPVDGPEETVAQRGFCVLM